jgi:hypothetical protein
MKAEHGVPCFGDTFVFPVYVKGLTEDVQGTKLVLFADDTNLLITRKDEFALQNKLTNVIRDIETWFHKNSKKSKSVITDHGGL